MIDLSHPISQKETYTTDHTQLLVTYDVTQAQRDYEFNNIVFAYVDKGIKNISIPGVKPFSLIPKTVIMGTTPIEAHVDIVTDFDSDPVHCFSLELSKEKVFGILDRLYSSDDFEAVSNQQHDLSPLNIYTGRGADMVMNNLLNLQEILAGDARFKDRWIDLKIEELILCCLQTNMYQSLISSYSQNRMLDNPLSAVISYIKSNYHTQIDVNKLAEKACMSHATFYRHFKQSLGTTPLEFIHGERIEEAKKLLACKEVSIGDISYQIGYNSPSYFSLQFEKHLGCSPRDYQKNNRN